MMDAGAGSHTRMILPHAAEDAMSTVLAIVVDPEAEGRLALREVPAPVPGRDEAIVRLAATSLNPGELRRVASAAPGWRPGWDIAGWVEQPAADGSGPPAGARVVGLLEAGAWAQRVAVPSRLLAALPDAVSFAQAATLPVAGLTALRALRRGGLLLGRRVLITGASGGVGHFACQLARLSGAHVVAAVRSAERAAAARESGAHEVIVGDPAAATQFAPYDLVLESVGGPWLAAALGMLAQDGICVSFGTTASPEVTFDARRFYLTGGASLYGFILFYEVARHPAGGDLALLAGMVADGRLRPRIDLELPWTEIASAARQLAERRVTGKIVLHLPA
jgi:NADPH2:quinone reductase